MRRRSNRLQAGAQRRTAQGLWSRATKKGIRTEVLMPFLIAD